jgi:hypothetical protein
MANSEQIPHMMRAAAEFAAENGVPINMFDCGANGEEVYLLDLMIPVVPGIIGHAHFLLNFATLEHNNSPFTYGTIKPRIASTA